MTLPYRRSTLPGCMAAPHLSPWSTHFVSTLVLAGPATMGPAPPSLSASTHCSSITRVTLHFVQKGLAVPLFLSSAKPVVPLAAVCVHARACFLLSLVAYLLSAHCVPGTVADFLWVCLLMPLLLLWGPHLCSLSPYCYLFVSLGVSGSVCPCLSAGPCLCLSLPWPLILPAGHSGSLRSPAHLFTHSLTLAGGFPQSHF